MHTRASRRRAARCAEQAPPSPLLLQLPAPAQRLVVSAVQEHDGLSSMRLANKAIKQLVDESATHLSLKQLIAMREDDLRRVRSTFPSLTSLCLSSADEYLTTSQQQAAAAAAANKAAALLVGSQPWPAIRTLALWDMPDEATELMVQHCPNVLEYKACSEDSSYSLGEPALRALAPCAALTQLEIDMFQPSDGVLEALLSLRGLTSLHVWFCLSDAPLPEMAWDLRGMAGLHTLDMVSKYPQALEGDELYDEEQRQLRNLEQQAYGTMRLPASLRELRALLMPAAPLPPLRLLELQHAAATDSTLLKLAVACPTLEQLDVFSLDITMAAHAAPLQAVTSLNVWHDVRATACARLAAVFPSLRELALNSASDAFGYSTQCLDGAVALSKFMVCHADGDGKGISMPRATFDLLAALPKLTILCLDAEHVHVEGVQLLTQLTRISWTVHGQGTDMLEELGAAFMACTAPHGLTESRVFFVCAQPPPAAAPPAGTTLLLSHVYDAVVSWLVRAPRLHKLYWQARSEGVGHMSATRLAAFAVSTSIKHIEIDQSDAEHPLFSGTSLTSMACMLARNRRVHVCVNGTHMCACDH